VETQLQILLILHFTQYKNIRGLPLSAVSLSCCITCQVEMSTGLDPNYRKFCWILIGSGL